MRKLQIERGKSPSFYLATVEGHRGLGTIAKTTGKTASWVATYMIAGAFGGTSREKRFRTRAEAIAWMAGQFGVAP